MGFVLCDPGVHFVPLFPQRNLIPLHPTKPRNPFVLFVSASASFGTSLNTPQLIRHRNQQQNRNPACIPDIVLYVALVHVLSGGLVKPPVLTGTLFDLGSTMKYKPASLFSPSSKTAISNEENSTPTSANQGALCVYAFASLLLGRNNFCKSLPTYLFQRSCRSNFIGNLRSQGTEDRIQLGSTGGFLPWEMRNKRNSSRIFFRI
jgi:hypothetical protein